MLHTLGGVGVEGRDFARPKPLLLLAYLSLEGPQLRRHLAELFWPGNDAARRSLTTAIVRLRKALPGAIEADESRVWTALGSDVADLRAALREGETARATALYRGAFLAGLELPSWPPELEEWVYGLREAVAEELRAALLRDARVDAGSGRYEVAAATAARAWTVAGAAAPEPERLTWLHTVLLAADHPLAREVREEAAGYDARLHSTSAEAREALHALRHEEAPHHLPLRGGTFVGREVELAELVRLLPLPERRLTTLVGPGGTGKTRLALEAARQSLLGGGFPDGVHFVGLEALRDAAAVPAAIAEALGLEVPADSDPMARLSGHLGSRRVLLLLDNVEQLPGVERHVEALLERCAHLTLLLTSRRRLALPAEWVVALTGLAYPGGSLAPEEAARFDAPALFALRARQAGAMLDPARDMADVLRLCRLLAGAPLGLELAAAWTNLLSCREIAEEVARTFDVLRREGTLGDERHGSLRVAFDHSWQLLAPEEREALARLSMFRGGFTREAAEAVGGHGLRTLASLARQSLLQRGEDGRFALLEVTREFAHERLAEDPLDLRRTEERHLAFFLDLAERGEAGMRGADQVAWTERLTRERDDLRAAMDRCLRGGGTEPGGGAEAGLRIAAALQMFWWVRGAYREGLARTDALLAAADDAVTPAVRAKALHRAATLAQELGEYPRAASMYEQALALATEYGERLLQADTLHSLGLLATKRGDSEGAVPYYRRSLALQRELNDDWGLSATLNNMGVNAMVAGRYEEARGPLLESLEHKRRMGEQRGISYALHNLGTVYYALGDLNAAQDHTERSLALKRDLLDEQGLATSQANLGRIALRRGRTREARGLLAGALRRLQAVENRWALASTLTAAIDLEATSGRPEAALRLAGAVEALCSHLAMRLPQLSECEATRGRDLAAAALGPARVERLLHEGRALPLDRLLTDLAENAAGDAATTPG